MFSWFQKHTSKKIGFDDMLYAIKNPNRYILINTLPVDSPKMFNKRDFTRRNRRTNH